VPRPFKARMIYGEFAADYYKPCGRRLSELQEIYLEADEIEALRLADLEGNYQNDAADKMGVSRQTFGNIIKNARQKVADALINGKAIRLNPPAGGRHRCGRCGQPWAQTGPVPEMDECPECVEKERNGPHRRGGWKKHQHENINK